MADISVAILDHTGSRKTNVEMPDDLPMSKLIPALVEALGLPNSVGKNNITYRLDHRKTGRRLEENDTLKSAGVEEDDIISLLPELSAGGQEELPPPENLSGIDEVLNAIADIRTQVEQLQTKSRIPDLSTTKVSELDKRLEVLFSQFKEQISDESVKNYTELLDEIRQQKAAQTNVGDFTAPVEMPAPEQMKVKLVPSHLLTRLEETRFDQSRWDSVGWAFVGAILGVIVNWITSEEIIISRPGMIVVLTFVIMAALAFVAARQYGSRAENIRAEMMKADLNAEVNSVRKAHRDNQN